MEIMNVTLSPRKVTGKKVNQLRRQGMVPVHIYGQGIKPQSLQVDALVLRKLLPQVGTNIPMSVELDGQAGQNICFIREVQRHPVTEDLLHVDFMRVDVSTRIRSDVPISLDGDAPAVRLMGGTLLQPLQSIVVESLPMDVPPAFRVDVTSLDDFEKGIYVRDLEININVSILTDANDLIARVSPPRIDIVEEEGDGGEIDGESAEGLDTEDAAGGDKGGTDGP